MRWHEMPVVQTVFVLAVMAGVVSVQNVFVTQLFPQYSQKQASMTLPQTDELVKVQAATCPYNSGSSVPTGQTETDANNAENRWPISQNRHEYDVFGPGYFDLVPNNDQGILNLTKTDGGAVDSKMNNFMASMFGFKPKKLVAAYDMKYAGAPRGADTEIKGNAPVLEVAVDPNNPIIKVPATGYDIGGGYEAMVVFAASDRVTIHIGRHEYFVGTKKCASGNTCSGGYWIYVKNICVDQKIQDAYNSVKAAQESAGANLNPINLPMVQPGQILGKATNGKIIVGVRDNGPFISTFKPVYWGGVSEQDYGNGGGTLPTATPQGGGTLPTATPQGGGTLPTATPQGGGQQGASDTFVGFGVDGSIEVTNGFVKIPICWSIKSGKTKADVMTAINNMGELNLKINGQVARWTSPFLNVDLQDFRLYIQNEYSSLANTNVITPPAMCKDATMSIDSLRSFGAGTTHTFQVVPVNATGLASPVRTENNLLAAGGGQPTATPTVEPPTPTRTTCVQPNMYYCATNNTCTSSKSQCDGIPTNTPIPTPTNSVGGVTPTTAPSATPTQGSGNIWPTLSPNASVKISDQTSAQRIVFNIAKNNVDCSAASSVYCLFKDGNAKYSNAVHAVSTQGKWYKVLPDASSTNETSSAATFTYNTENELLNNIAFVVFGDINITNNIVIKIEK